MDEFWQFCLGFSALKLLFIPQYHSTDFEVHRNWMAITHSLPVKDWYHENTSQWTLDYPPFFAWFEFLLSQFAGIFDSDMLKVDNLNYASYKTVVYQRLTVIAADVFYLFAVKRITYTIGKVKLDRQSKPSVTRHHILSILLATNAGLLIVDHMHFQYNGFLFGFFLMSVVNIYERKPYHAAFWFAVLLNFKHIFLYIAPAYFVYLLRTNCITGSVWKFWQFSYGTLVRLAVVVLSVFAVSFGPFILLGQLPQVLSRLFPFKRGLCHAYWAPNFWALYNIIDKVSFTAARRLGFANSTVHEAGVMTSGLVQEFQHQFLPTITPQISLMCVLASIIPGVLLAWSCPSRPEVFLRSTILCAFGSFLFGWHVHEKAILLVIIPLTVLAITNKTEARIFQLLSTTGHFALMPLIFTPFEQPVKYLILLLYFIIVHWGLSHPSLQWSKKCASVGVLSWQWLEQLERVYLLGLIPLELYCQCGHYFLGLSHLPFLPLLLTSVYCSVGVLYAWIVLMYHSWSTYSTDYTTSTCKTA